jgi:hypothetical protein
MADNLNFEELEAHLKLKFMARDDVESVDGTNFFQEWVNKAYKWLVTRDRFWEIKFNYRFPQLEVIDTSQTLTASTAYLTIPDKTLYTLEIYDSTEKRALDWMDPREYLRKTDRADTNAYTDPSHWTHIETYYYFWPTPDAANSLEILRRKIPDPLTGTGTTDIGEEWDEAILYLASWIGHDWLGEIELADRAKDNFTEYVKGLIAIYYNEEKAGHKTYGLSAQSKRYDFGRK